MSLTASQVFFTTSSYLKYLRRGLEDPNVSRITIIIDVNSQNEAEQIIKQLNRQIDVIRIRDITDQPIHLEREVILIKGISTNL